MSPYRENIFKFDEFTAAAESGRLYRRQVSDLVTPRDCLAGFDLLRPRHNLQYHGRSTNLFVSVKRRVLQRKHIPQTFSVSRRNRLKNFLLRCMRKPAYSVPVPSPENRDGCGRKGIWRKILGNTRIILALVCVAAAASQLVVT